MAQDLVVQLLLKTGTFSTDLKQAGGQIKNFKSTCQGASNTLSSFTRGLGINVGSLAKFGSAAGIAATAANTLKTGFMQNTDAMDDFNKGIEKAKATYTAFTSQIFKKGAFKLDFSGIAEQASEYYDAIDKAQTAASAINTELQLQELTYNRLWYTAMDVSLSEVDRLEALNQATVVMAKQVELKRQLANLNKTVAKEDMENSLVSRGISKNWLESKEGQELLEKFLKYDKKNASWAFDTYFGSVNTINADTGAFGHPGIFGRAAEKSKTKQGAAELENRAKELRMTSEEYMKFLKKMEDQATAVVNSNKYQLAQALHNLRGSTEGVDTISKYITLYLNDAGDMLIDYEEQQTKAMIERLKKRITSSKSSSDNKKDYGEGSIGKQNEIIRDINEQIVAALDQVTRDKLYDQLEAEEKILQLMMTRTPKEVSFTKGSLDYIDQKLEEEKAKLAAMTGEAIGLPETTEIVNKMNTWIGTWEEFIKSLSDSEKELFKQFEDNLKKRWDQQNEVFKYQMASNVGHAARNPKEININTPDLKTNKSQWSEYASTLSQVSNIASSLTSVLMDLTGAEKDSASGWNAFMKGISTGVAVFQLMANVIDMVSKLTVSNASQQAEAAAEVATANTAEATAVVAAKQAEAAAAGGDAAAKGADAVAGIPIIGPALAVAAAASIAAAIIAAMASAKSAASGLKFANGGIVGGSSFTGDRVSANVNSGEMILNGAQQARLFRMANGSNEGRSQVEFHISGTDLVGVLNNQNRKNRIIR